MLLMLNLYPQVLNRNIPKMSGEEKFTNIVNSVLLIRIWMTEICSICHWLGNSFPHHQNIIRSIPIQLYTCSHIGGQTLFMEDSDIRTFSILFFIVNNIDKVLKVIRDLMEKASKRLSLDVVEVLYGNKWWAVLYLSAFIILRNYFIPVNLLT